MQKRTRSGETYLDSATVQDIIYDALMEEIPNHPKDLMEAAERLGIDTTKECPTVSEELAIFGLFPHFEAFRQALFASGGSADSEAVHNAKAFYRQNGISR